MTLKYLIHVTVPRRVDITLKYLGPQTCDSAQDSSLFFSFFFARYNMSGCFGRDLFQKCSWLLQSLLTFIYNTAAFFGDGILYVAASLCEMNVTLLVYDG